LSSGLATRPILSTTTIDCQKSEHSWFSICSTK
jgi:hypothetical protein